jgi:hypothetical protein
VIHPDFTPVLPSSVNDYSDATERLRDAPNSTALDRNATSWIGHNHTPEDDKEVKVKRRHNDRTAHAAAAKGPAVSFVGL